MGNKGAVGASYVLAGGLSRREDPSLNGPLCGLTRRTGWECPSLKQAEETTNSARTYWEWLTRWSWSCRGLCPRCGRVGSRFLSRRLETILKWTMTRHVIWLQTTNLKFPICPDLGHLLTISGLKYSTISSGWKPKATMRVPFTIYHLLLTRRPLRKAHSFLLWIPTFLPLLLLFPLAPRSSPLSVIQMWPISQVLAVLKQWSLQPEGHRGGLSTSIINSTPLCVSFTYWMPPKWFL